MHNKGPFSKFLEQMKDCTFVFCNYLQLGFRTCPSLFFPGREKMREGTRLHTAGAQLAEFAQALPSSSASSPPAATATATSEVVSDGLATGKKDGVQTSCCVILGGVAV